MQFERPPENEQEDFELAAYVDEIEGWSEEEKVRLKEQMRFPGIKNRLRELMLIEQQADRPSEEYQILLADFRKDLEEFRKGSVA